jgi:Protein of unknown function (DUF3303)
MKFLVELRFKPGGKDKAFETFELRGPNRHPGVTFRGAWVATQSEVAYALVESEDEAQVAKAAQSWVEQGDYRITQVHDVEQL